QKSKKGDDQVKYKKRTFLFWYYRKDGKLIVFHDDNLKRVFGKDIELNASILNLNPASLFRI
ncbi:hypothetical protein HKBW3S42_01718, partial [Candidatus Hakubella thermalkaliphila]